MPRMRTIDQAYEYVLSQDAETSLTKTALRRLIVSGKLPSVKIGEKYLLNLDTLEAFLSGNVPDTPARLESTTIRRICV